MANAKKVREQLMRIEEAQKKYNHHVRNATQSIEGLLIEDRKIVVVKNTTVFFEIVDIEWHPILKEVVSWCFIQWPGQLAFTSGYRKNDPGVHGILPLPAVDLRSWSFDDPKVVADEINRNWTYNHPNKKLLVCVYHRTVLCKKCGNKFEIDPEIGVVSDTACIHCGADRSYLKDFGPHFHVQTRNETAKVVI